MNALRILPILLFAQISLSQDTGAASVIRGVVVNRESGRPISNASVELLSVRTPPTTRVTTSDDDGKFVFLKVGPGVYRMNAWRSGYVQAEYGQTGTHGPGAEFTVAAGQPPASVQIAMTPTGSIAGRITDRNGQPVGNARVQALRASYQDGQRVLTGVKEILTNDLGEYRLFWLPPGAYFVNVRVPDGPMGVTVLMNPGGTDSRGLYEARAQIGTVATIPVGSGAGESEAHVPVFFPGSANVLLATVIDVRAGADIRGINMTAAPVRTRRVRGILSNGTAGQPPGANAQVRLLPIAAGPSPEYQVSADRGTGAFEAPKVAPGSYIILATIGGPNTTRARGTLEVLDRDVDNVSLVATAGLAIPVRVTFEKQTVLTGLRVNLRSDPFVAGAPSSGVAIPAEGQATLSGVLPGDYRLYVSPLLNPQSLPAPSTPETLRNLYVKSARLGDRDVLNDGLRLGSPPEGVLEIVIGSNPGRLSGIVTAAGPGITVVLVPDNDRGFRTDRHKTAVTDAAGNFALQGIPPGSYRLFAWKDVAPGAWMDREFLRIHESRSEAIVISEGGSHTAQLSVIP
jgi:hypothetical protein